MMWPEIDRPASRLRSTAARQNPQPLVGVKGSYLKMTTSFAGCEALPKGSTSDLWSESFTAGAIVAACCRAASLSVGIFALKAILVRQCSLQSFQN